jgi:hypothetical protein
MTILNDKDATTRIENVRYFRKKKDPPYSDVLNRPLEDLEERSNDVWDIMEPAKQLYVHQKATPSLTVEVEPGWIFNEQSFGTDTSPIYFPGQDVTVALCAPNKIRMDLVYFDRSANNVKVVTGTEVQESTGFTGLWDEPTPLRAVLPTAHVNLIPLAYLYVGSRATETFQDAALITAAGHIRDCRMGSNVNWNLTGGTPELLADTPGGSAGTIQKVARGNHRHPVNLPTSGVTGSAAKTERLEFNNVRAPGTENTYSRIDHVHDLNYSGTYNDFEEDYIYFGTGQVGSLNDLARADHGHPLHFDPANPLPADLHTSLGNYYGVNSGNYYARHDHRHWVSGDIFMTVQARELKWYEYSSYWGRYQGESDTKTTGSFSGRPLFAITLCCGKFYSAAVGWTNWRDPPAYQSWGFVYEGNPPSQQYSIACQDYYNAGDDWWTASRESGSASHVAVPAQGYGTVIERNIACTYLGPAGATFAVGGGGLWHGYLSVISFGFIDVTP